MKKQLVFCCAAGVLAVVITALVWTKKSRMNCGECLLESLNAEFAKDKIPASTLSATQPSRVSLAPFQPPASPVLAVLMDNVPIKVVGRVDRIRVATDADPNEPKGSILRVVTKDGPGITAINDFAAKNPGATSFEDPKTGFIDAEFAGHDMPVSNSIKELQTRWIGSLKPGTYSVTVFTDLTFFSIVKHEPGRLFVRVGFPRNSTLLEGILSGLKRFGDSDEIAQRRVRDALARLDSLSDAELVKRFFAADSESLRGTQEPAIATELALMSWEKVYDADRPRGTVAIYNIKDQVVYAWTFGKIPNREQLFIVALGPSGEITWEATLVILPKSGISDPWGLIMWMLG